MNTKVHTLICKRDLANALLCFQSLYAAFSEQIDLVVHEDGSLDEHDWNVARARLPEVLFVRRSDREAEITDRLRQYPKCREYRALHPLSNKLLDIPLTCAGTIHFVDSDILFFQKVRSLFPEDGFPVFMHEDDEGHSAPLLDLVVKYRLPIPAGFNSGMFSLDASLLDMDRVEWFLGKPGLVFQLSLVEQTCYAMLTGDKGLRQFSPRQFFCSKFRPLTVDKQTVAVHFLYHLKSRIEAFHPMAMEMIEASAPVDVELSPARPLTIARIVKRRIMRRFVKVSRDDALAARR